MGSVFNTNTKCSLPSIPAIGNFDFISDCTVPETPPPIYECPDLEFDLPFAGPPGPAGIAGPPGPPGVAGVAGIGLCPEITISATGEITQKRGISFPAIDVTANITNISVSSSEVCQKQLDLNIGLSLPCADIDFVGSVSLVGVSDAPSLEIEKHDKYPNTDNCGSVIDFKFKLPRASVWRSGIGPPDNDLGEAGDYYLDLSTGDVYFKNDNTLNDNTWNGPITNLRGLDGSNGSDGRDGSNGSDGYMPCCPQTTYASIVTGVYCQGNQLIVQYQS